MSATFRTSWGAETVVGSGTVNKGVGVSSGDTQIVLISAGANFGTLGISGGNTWNQIGTTQIMSSGGNIRVGVWVQVAGGSEPSTYDIANDSGTGATILGLTYSGNDTSVPIAQIGTFANADTTPAPSPITMTVTGVTTSNAHQTLIYLATLDWSAAPVTTFSAPSGFTTRNQFGITIPSFTNGYGASSVQAAAGASGSVSGIATASGQAGNYIGILLALNDGDTGGGGGGSTESRNEKINRGINRGMNRGLG